MRALGLVLAVGCAEPFGVQREVLGPFRIAALGVVDGQAEAAIWAGQPFTEAPLNLEWHLDDTVLGEGWGLTVPLSAAGQTLGLRATAPDGTTREASVTVGAAPDPFRVLRQPVDLSEIWSLEDRRDAKPLAEDADEVSSGLSARLVAEVEPGSKARFRVPEGQGTLLSLTSATADLLPEDLQFEDGEVTTRTPVEPGLATVLVLSLDGHGGNRWQWVQVSMGLTLGARVRHEGFVLEAEGADARTGLLAITLTDLDPASGTFSAVDAEPVTDTAEQDPLACGPAPFRLAWLWEGRCTVDDAEGRRVVLEVW